MPRWNDEYEELLRKMRNDECDFRCNKTPKSYFGQYTNRWGEITWEDLIFDHMQKIRAALIATFKSIFFKKNTKASEGGAGGGDDNLPPNNPRGNFNMNWKLTTAVVVLVLTLAVSPLMIGINDAGHRTVIQYPTGTLVVKFEPGIYMQYLGSTTEYNDVITFDFDKTVNSAGGSIDQEGITVRYQDGGTGTVFGIARFRLPSDEAQMVKIHKEFRSNDGVAFKIIKNTTEEVMNHTAGLMTSEESYAEKRGTFTEYAKEQLNRGKFGTVQKEIITVEAGMEFCLEQDLTKELEKECHNVKKTTKFVPIIAKKDGMDVHLLSDLKQYGITVSGFNMIDWGYEQKTLDQIAAKRQATMAIITAKANAEKAKQDAITAEQQGLANVTVAKYEKEVEKQRAVVDAEKAKEVAVIDAQQKVAVAEQEKFEAEQRKLAAVEEKQRQILLGQGEAERKRLVMAADGALQQKLDAWKEVNFKYAEMIPQYKGNWVPGVVMGGAGEQQAGGNGAQDLINMLSVKTAKDLALDLQIKGSTSK